MHLRLRAAVYIRHGAVDLKDDLLGVYKAGTDRTLSAAETEIALVVHLGHTEHGDIHIDIIAVVCFEAAEEHGYEKRSAGIAHSALVRAAVPCIVYKMLHFGVAFHDLDRTGHKVAPDLYAVQLVLPRGQRRIQRKGHGIV